MNQHRSSTLNPRPKETILPLRARTNAEEPQSHSNVFVVSKNVDGRRLAGPKRLESRVVSVQRVWARSGTGFSSSPARSNPFTLAIEGSSGGPTRSSEVSETKVSPRFSDVLQECGFPALSETPNRDTSCLIFKENAIAKNAGNSAQSVRNGHGMFSPRRTCRALNPLPSFSLVHQASTNNRPIESLIVQKWIQRLLLGGLEQLG